MRTIKYNNKASEVITLCELLNAIGYQLVVSDSFTLAIDTAVKDFQQKNNLVVDGIVGMKTWSKLFEQQSQLVSHNNKFLSEQDLIDFANVYSIELAAIKAVNEVESGGKGFLLSGKPKILFEGHVFWSELESRGINPNNYVKDNQDILYFKWTKNYYLGGEAEYNRLNKAMQIHQEAALSSASWGCFQIMGFHARSLGYNSVKEFVDKMYISEREHLFALGKFLENHHANLIQLLKDKNWDRFAYYYNGPSYAQNKYDEKLQKAYVKYSS